MVDGARDYRLMTRQMVDSILSMNEYNRYMKGMFDYVGFNVKWISYEAPDRKVGESKFGLKKLIKYAVGGITSSSTAPLMMISPCPSVKYSALASLAIFIHKCFSLKDASSRILHIV